ncbi:TPA: hypothetical protein ACG0NJ_002188 [Clostridium perfringens]|jgi:hypothetical protein|uniref:hypothetical protein n=1 Tax=Clostridium perfringens TaxID=1502 RepID=UPI0018E419D1|nr:hypothetical protein [Clostridium perfringens]MBI6033734.1 hypothetical protein [Clostridium perfringens]MDM0731962.1 hypothetical protein [Clostridium perfringens]UBK67523.1 hypothetical protein KLF46_13895 [Clostridium perfringens]
MSKLNIKLSYKNACILKHALRDKVNDTRIFLESPGVVEIEEKELERLEKEHEEEKRALAAITEEIERYSIRFPRRSK